jgi:hypothetical protein
LVRAVSRSCRSKSTSGRSSATARCHSIPVRVQSLFPRRARPPIRWRARAACPLHRQRADFDDRPRERRRHADARRAGNRGRFHQGIHLRVAYVAMLVKAQVRLPRKANSVPVAMLFAMGSPRDGCGAPEDLVRWRIEKIAIIADYDAQSAVDRELVLRLTSLLWQYLLAKSLALQPTILIRSIPGPTNMGIRCRWR